MIIIINQFNKTDKQKEIKRKRKKEIKKQKSIMVYLWHIYGMFMDILWIFYGMFMDILWIVYLVLWMDYGYTLKIHNKNTK